MSPQADPHYEVPPTEYYDVSVNKWQNSTVMNHDYVLWFCQDDYDEQGRLLHGREEEEVDDRFYDRPEDRYPGYQPQPRYDVRP